MTQTDGLDAVAEQRLAALAREADDLRPELHRYAARLVGSVIDGEDVIQEAFANALAAIGSLAPGTPLRPWLFRIVHNLAIDMLRQHKVRRSEPLETVYDLADLNAADAEDALIRQDAVRAALNRFAELPLPQRSAVILKDVLDESLVEIAALLELTVDAVKAHLWRGRATLRSMSEMPRGVPPRPSADALNFAALFNARDWDALRRLLADDVRLRQARRPPIAGVAEVGHFFSYYAAYPPVRVTPGWLEGREILLVTDVSGRTPSYFMLLEWRDRQISLIRDHRYASYVMDGAEVVEGN